MKRSTLILGAVLSEPPHTIRGLGKLRDPGRAGVGSGESNHKEMVKPRGKERLINQCERHTSTCYLIFYWWSMLLEEKVVYATSGKLMSTTLLIYDMCLNNTLSYHVQMCMPASSPQPQTTVSEQWINSGLLGPDMGLCTLCMYVCI